MKEKQAYLGEHSRQTIPSDANYLSHDSTPRRLQTRRSTSSMTAVQSYYSSSTSSTYPHLSSTYNPYYFPSFPASQSAHSTSRESFAQHGAGGHAMQSSRSLGGMASSNANVPFAMPDYDMNHLQNLAPQALALSLGGVGSHSSIGSITHNSIPASTHAPSSFHGSSEDTLCVSPQLIMDPLAGSNSSGDQVGSSTSRRSSGPSYTALSFPTTIQRQPTQSQGPPFPASSPSGRYSTNSSPLANRYVDVTLSPALEFPLNWRLPSSALSHPGIGTATRPSSSASTFSQRGSFSGLPTQSSYDANTNLGAVQLFSSEYSNSAVLPSNMSTINTSYIPDSGYSTQGRPSPSIGQLHPPSSSTSSFRYSGYEPGATFPPTSGSGHERTIYNSTSTSSNTRPSSEPVSGNAITETVQAGANFGHNNYPSEASSFAARSFPNPERGKLRTYPPPRRRSYNGLASASHSVGQAPAITSSSGQVSATGSNKRPYRTRTRQNMQGLVHSDHVDQGFPGEWGGAFR